MTTTSHAKTQPPADAGSQRDSTGSLERDLRRRSLLRELLRGGEIRTLFQPIVEIENLVGAPFAFEALSRGALGSPLATAKALFGAARREGREIEADRVCIASALSSARQLPGESRISLNVHARTLASDATLATFLQETAQRTGIDPRRLVIEIVEHILESDVGFAARNLDRLRSMGAGVAIDDFGTGGSRLYLLHALRPDFIKIDRHLLMAARRGGNARSILDLVIRYARRQGARSVVEGVETQDDVDLAREMGADLVQGFLIGEPRSAGALANEESGATGAAGGEARASAAGMGSEVELLADRWQQVRALDLPMLWFDGDGELLDMNDAALALLGSETRQTFAELFRAPATSTDEPQHPEISELGRDGCELIWTGASGARQRFHVRPALVDPGGVFVVLDPPREQARWFATGLVEMFARGVHEQAMIVLDSRGRIAEWNEGALDLLGFQKGQALRRPFHELLDLRLARGARRLERMLAMARADLSWQGAVELTDVRGARRPMHLTILPLRDYERRTRAFAVFALDLTTRVDMERELELRQRRLAMNLKIFEALLEGPSEGVIVASAVEALSAELHGCRIVLSLCESTSSEEEVPGHALPGAGADDGEAQEAHQPELDETALSALCELATPEFQGGIAVVENVETEPRLHPLRPALARDGVQAALAARISVRGRTPARLAAVSPSERSWTETEIEVFEDAARALTIAFSHLATIHEKELAEARASEREEQLRGLTDALPGAVYQVERRGGGPATMRYLSAGFDELAGRDRREIRSFRDLDDAVSAQDRSVLRAMVERSRSTGRPWAHEFRLQRPDGESRWIRATSVRKQVEGSDTETWNGVLLDVTEGKLAMQGLAQARNEWAATVDAVSDMIVLEDSEGRLLRCNRAVSEYFRRPFQSLVGTGLVELLFGPTAHGTDRAALRSRRKIVKLHGDADWFEISNFPIAEGPGRKSYWVHVLSNVTERRHFEEEARRLAAAIEQTAEAIVITSRDGTIEYMNPACGRFSARGAQHLRGSSAVELARRLLSPEVTKEILARLRAGYSWAGEHAVGDTQGPVRHLKLDISPVRSSSGEVTNYVTVASDVTERNRLEAIADAVNISEQTGFIFATLRHEIGNPINSIKAALSVLRRNFTEYPRETITSYLDRTLSEVSRVEYLLRLFKTFSAQDRLHLDTIRIPGFFDEFRKLVARELGGRGVELALDIDDGVESVTGDPRALSQALLNVVTNAADAVEGVPAPRIELRVRSLGRRVEVRVSDNGTGIPNEELGKIFRPFFTNKPSGTGLGLAIVRKLLTMMGGTVEIRSQVGQGTDVILTLPGDEAVE